MTIGFDFEWENGISQVIQVSVNGLTCHFNARQEDNRVIVELSPFTIQIKKSFEKMGLNVEFT